MSHKSPEILKFFPEPIFKYKVENFKDFNEVSSMKIKVYLCFNKDHD